MFSRTQHAHLEALGYVLYQPRDVAASSPVSTITNAPAGDDFWQTALGRNIARVAQHADATKVHIPNAMQSAQAKRAVWHQLKALRIIQ